MGVLIGLIVCGFLLLVVALCNAASRTSRMEERWEEEVREYDRFPYNRKDGGLDGKR